MKTFLAAPPVSAFAMVMGLSGLTLMWRKLGVLSDHHLAHQISLGFGALTIFIFCLLAVGMVRKWLVMPEAVMEEWQHPVKSAFFGAISIGVCLLSVVIFPFHHALAEGIWVMGATLHLGAILAVLNAWVHRENLQASHACPVWFIPAVGNVVVPIGGVALGYEEVSWFFFGIGVIFWIVLLSLVMYRLMFIQPGLPDRLKPTLAIFLAPPTVSFTSWILLTHQDGANELDHFGHILISIGFFFALFLLMQLKRFARLPFFMSWWAYSFPSASFTIAVLNYSMFSSWAIYVGYAAAVFTTILIVGLLWRTLMAIHIKDPQWVD